MSAYPVKYVTKNLYINGGSRPRVPSTRLLNPNHKLPFFNIMANHPADDMMLIDDEYDGEGDDQLIDDDDAQPTMPHTERASPSSLDTSAYPERSLSDPKPNSRRRRPQESSIGPQASIDKSIRKREQREREKEQQKQLLAKLIEIFGKCATYATPVPTLISPFSTRGRRWYLRSTTRSKEIPLG